MRTIRLIDIEPWDTQYHNGGWIYAFCTDSHSIEEDTDVCALLTETLAKAQHPVDTMFAVDTDMRRGEEDSSYIPVVIIKYWDPNANYSEYDIPPAIFNAFTDIECLVQLNKKLTDYTINSKKEPENDIKIALVYDGAQLNYKSDKGFKTYIIRPEGINRFTAAQFKEKLNYSGTRCVGISYAFDEVKTTPYNDNSDYSEAKAFWYSLVCFQSVMRLETLEEVLRDAGFIMRTAFRSTYGVPGQRVVAKQDVSSPFDIDDDTVWNSTLEEP